MSSESNLAAALVKHGKGGHDVYVKFSPKKGDVSFYRKAPPRPHFYVPYAAISTARKSQTTAKSILAKATSAHISEKIAIIQREENKKRDAGLPYRKPKQVQAIAYSMAKKSGFSVEERENPTLMEHAKKLAARFRGKPAAPAPVKGKQWWAVIYENEPGSVDRKRKGLLGIWNWNGPWVSKGHAEAWIAKMPSKDRAMWEVHSFTPKQVRVFNPSGTSQLCPNSSCRSSPHPTSPRSILSLSNRRDSSRRHHSSRTWGWSTAGLRT